MVRFPRKSSSVTVERSLSVSSASDLVDNCWGNLRTTIPQCDPGGNLTSFAKPKSLLIRINCSELAYFLGEWTKLR